MQQDNFKDKVIKGTLWSFLEAFARQFISFLLGLILARLLFPSDYGLIGMLMFFIAICQVFIDCGFANALICKKDRDDKDFSTAFYFNLIIGVVAYLILFIIAPYVAEFYNEPILKSLLRVVALSVVFNSLSIVQNAILTATLKMRLLTVVSVISQIIAGIVGVILAYAGFGVWALAIQSVGGSFMTMLTLWIVTKWRPRESWSNSSFKYLWGFGSKMLFVGLISNAYSNIHSMLIGKFFNKNQLGLYSKSYNLSRIIPNTLYLALNKVSLPSFSSISDDNIHLKQIFRSYVLMASFIIFPIMGLMIVLAKPLILFLWTEKWNEAIPIFQIMCMGCVWNTLNLLSISILQVKQRPDLLLRLEIINKIVGFILLVITIPMGFYSVIIGRACYNFYEYIVYSICSNKMLLYTLKEQIVDIFPYILLTIVSCVFAYLIQGLVEKDFLKLLLGGSVGIASYISLSCIFRLRAWSDTLKLIKSIF